jgi:hypothetical protein
MKVGLIDRTADLESRGISPVRYTPVVIDCGPAGKYRIESALGAEFRCQLLIVLHYNSRQLSNQHAGVSPGSFHNAALAVMKDDARHGDLIRIGPFTFEICIEAEWAIRNPMTGSDLPAIREGTATSSNIRPGSSGNRDLGGSEEGVNEEILDLKAFRRSLGSAPPVRFNSEGSLCERGWGEIEPIEEIVQKLGRTGAVAPRKKPAPSPEPNDVQRRRRKEVIAAAIVLLCYGAVALLWSKTEWQRRIESLVQQQDQTQLLASPQQPPMHAYIQAGNCAYACSQRPKSARPSPNRILDTVRSTQCRAVVTSKRCCGRPR